MTKQPPLNPSSIPDWSGRDDHHQHETAHGKTPSTTTVPLNIETERPDTIQAIEEHLLPAANAGAHILASNTATREENDDATTEDTAFHDAVTHQLPNEFDGISDHQSIQQGGPVPQDLERLQESLKDHLNSHVQTYQTDTAHTHVEEQPVTVDFDQQSAKDSTLHDSASNVTATQEPSSQRMNVDHQQFSQPDGVQNDHTDSIPPQQEYQSQAAPIDPDSHMDGTTHDPYAHDIEIDEWDGSDFSDTSSFLSHLSNSITDYQWENGRRYHAYQGGRYPLPNDETELDREDMKHHEMMLITSNRLHLSPIPEKPQRILDIGTGTGIWAMQMADKYPSAEVVGTDLSPVQSDWVPPNLTFEIDDAEQPWLHKPNSYDLINIRFMFLAIKDFPKLIRNAYDTLKPGAWIELSELNINPRSYDAQMPDPSQILLWIDYLRQAATAMGFDMQIARKFKGMVIEAGFEEVTEEILEVPWGIWPKDQRLKEIGFWHKEQLKQGLQGIAMGLLTRSLGWTPSEVELFLVGLRKEIDDRSLHIIDSAYIVYGRKPLQ
ncbi:MAG: hypothetical protein M1836_003621 [Candelina mexicana]|nr:MAG: hypothetical protein M1836_003621 [Candelina mexicana]